MHKTAVTLLIILAAFIGQGRAAYAFGRRGKANSGKTLPIF